MQTGIFETAKAEHAGGQAFKAVPNPAGDAGFGLAMAEAVDAGASEAAAAPSSDGTPEGDAAPQATASAVEDEEMDAMEETAKEVQAQTGIAALVEPNYIEGTATPPALEVVAAEARPVVAEDAAQGPDALSKDGTLEVDAEPEATGTAVEDEEMGALEMAPLDRVDARPKDTVAGPDPLEARDATTQGPFEVGEGLDADRADMKSAPAVKPLTERELAEVCEKVSAGAGLSVEKGGGEVELELPANLGGVRIKLDIEGKTAGVRIQVDNAAAGKVIDAAGSNALKEALAVNGLVLDKFVVETPHEASSPVNAAAGMGMEDKKTDVKGDVAVRLPADAVMDVDAPVKEVYAQDDSRGSEGIDTARAGTKAAPAVPHPSQAGTVAADADAVEASGAGPAPEAVKAAGQGAQNGPAGSGGHDAGTDARASQASQASQAEQAEQAGQAGQAGQAASKPVQMPPAALINTGQVSNEPAPVEARPLTGPERAEVFGKVSAGVRMSVARDGGEVRLNLRPEHLGRLDIRLKIDEKLVKARIQVESAAVKHVLDSDSGALKEIFAKSGLVLDRYSVEVAPKAFSAAGNGYGGGGLSDFSNPAGFSGDGGNRGAYGKGFGMGPDNGNETTATGTDGGNYRRTGVDLFA